MKGARKKKRRASPWRKYEHDVFHELRALFGPKHVRKNVKLRGRFSKRMRQIDILVTAKSGANELRMVVDAKHFRRKVDVKTVESFAAFVNDLGVEKGLLITNGGYTKAALRRALYDPGNLELDILNFDQLRQFQAFAALPYAGDITFLVRAPLGWVVDAQRPEGVLARLYQRGLDFSLAQKQREWIYINYWNRAGESTTLEELDEIQRKNILLHGPATFRNLPPISRPDARCLIRVAATRKRKYLEVTGLLEFPHAIFFAVLLTPRERLGPNVRRLTSILQTAQPVNVRRDNTKLIAKIDEQLASSGIAADARASLLVQKGHWLRDMKLFDAARVALEESIALRPVNWGAFSELLPVLLNLNERDAVLASMHKLLRLAPQNPTVYIECCRYAHSEPLSPADVVGLLDSLKAERESDILTGANCDFYAASLLFGDDPKPSKMRFALARMAFAKVFPPSHDVFRAIRTALRDMRKVGEVERLIVER